MVAVFVALLLVHAVNEDAAKQVRDCAFRRVRARLRARAPKAAKHACIRSRARKKSTRFHSSKEDDNGLSRFDGWSEQVCAFFEPATFFFNRGVPLFFSPPLVQLPISLGGLPALLIAKIMSVVWPSSLFLLLLLSPPSAFRFSPLLRCSRRSQRARYSRC